MSFSKSKRFPYSASVTGVERLRSNACKRSHSFSGDSRNNQRPSTKYTIYFPPDSMPVDSPVVDHKNLRKIDTKLYYRNVFNMSEYFMDESGNITNPSEDLASPDKSLIYDNLQKDMKDKTKSLDNIHKVNSISEIEQLLDKTQKKVNDIIEEAVARVKDEAEKKMKDFVHDMMDFNVKVIEEVKSQCKMNMDSLTDTVKEVLSKNNSNNEDDLRRLISMLLEQLEDGKRYADFLDSNYTKVLKAAERTIHEQANVIGTLKAEIDADEINFKMQRMYKK